MLCRLAKKAHGTHTSGFRIKLKAAARLPLYNTCHSTCPFTHTHTHTHTQSHTHAWDAVSHRRRFKSSLFSPRPYTDQKEGIKPNFLKYSKDILVISSLKTKFLLRISKKFLYFHWHKFLN